MHKFLSHGRLNLKPRHPTVKSAFYFLCSLREERTAIEILFGTNTRNYSFSSDSGLNAVHYNLRPIVVKLLKYCL